MEAPFAAGGETKTIVKSIVSSGLPAEEVIKHLDSYGIDWYVTEKDDLMIRYWQIGAEDFVPKERVGTIGESQTVVPPEPTALEWLSKHLTKVKSQYSNRWIAIIDNRVTADAENLPVLLQKVQNAEIENPFITFIPGEPIVWSTAYGQQNI